MSAFSSIFKCGLISQGLGQVNKGNGDVRRVYFHVFGY